MKMPNAEPPSLRDAAIASEGLPHRFVADSGTLLTLRQLLAGPALHPSAGDPSGRTFMIACESQLAAARAMIALDGPARRIVLCPPDLDPRHLPQILGQAGVDAIVSDEATPGAGLTVTPGPGPSGPPANPQAAPKAAPRDRTEWVMFTSGTTGPPKMVVHDLQSLAGHLPPGPPQGGAAVWCTFYDIRRYGGLQILLRALVGGGSIVLSDPSEPPGAFMARAATHGATHLLGTPSHWRRALMTPESRLISPRYVRLSGEVADQGVLDRLRALFPAAKLVHAFASTETGVAFEVDDGRAGFPASLLQQNGTVNLRLRESCLQVRSGRLAVRRLGTPDSALADADGFVDTGDIVARDGDRCHFAGRKEGIVNVGGHKVHPEEVEAIINQHPGVQMSLVRSRSSPITGAVVVAEVVARVGPGTACEPDLSREILDLCRQSLSPYKVPATVRFRPSLEIAASGKLVRPRA